MQRLQRTKVPEQRLDEEQHQQAAGEVRKSRQGSGRRSVHTDDNVVTVQSLLLSQEDKSQSHRTVSEISREAWIRRSSVSRIIS